MFSRTYKGERFAQSKGRISASDDSGKLSLALSEATILKKKVVKECMGESTPEAETSRNAE